MNILIAALMILLGTPGHVANGDYLVSVPPGTAPAAGWPAVLVYHGAGGDAAQMQTATQYAPAGTVAVFLSGQGGRWNAGTCCGSERDDVAFSRQVVDQVETTTPIDRDHIYAIGFSNGGMMAIRMACDAPDLIRSAVSVSGSLVTPCRTAPIHILRIHDPGDGTVPLCEQPETSRGCQGFEDRWFPSVWKTSAVLRRGSTVDYDTRPYNIGTHRWPPHANQAITNYLNGATRR